MATNIEVVEALARASYATACADEAGLSSGWGVPYMAARMALKAAIVHTWPGIDVGRVIDVWIDCGETIAYCVNYVRTQRAALDMEDLKEELVIIREGMAGHAAN